MKVVSDELPPRKRGRPSNAERAARAVAEASYLAGLPATVPISTPIAPGPTPVGDAVLPKAAPGRVERPIPLEAPVQPQIVVKAPMYTPEMPPDVSPLDYMLTLMRDANVAAERRDRAAQIAIGFLTAKPGEGKKGKKEQAQELASEIAAPGNKYAPGRPPLAAVK